MTFDEAVGAALAMRLDGRPGVARLFQELLAAATDREIAAPAAEPLFQLRGHRSIGLPGNKYGRRGKASACEQHAEMKEVAHVG